MNRKKYTEAYCTGCGLCHSANKSIIKDDNRLFPNVKLDTNEKLDFYQKVCPVYYYADSITHDVWGLVDKAFVGYSSDAQTRYKAASGGALTELCSYLLESQTVNGIIHTTYDPKDSTRTVSVISRTVDEVKQRCGSRYSISVPLMNILQSLVAGEKYAFVGKPCDVMALKRYCDINPEINDQIPFLLSFYCAGEPSVNAQKKLLEKMNCTFEECENITYRGNGWPGYTTVVKKDGNVEKLEYKITWGQFLGRDLRNICRFCLDGTGDAADIVCADFWYLDQNNYPDFSEHEGRNIIISRNKRGSQLIEEAKNAGRLTIESDFTDKMKSDFHLYQPAQYKRKGTMKYMILAMKLCGKMVPRYDKKLLDRYANHLDSQTKVRYFIGVVKRIIKGKL